MPTTPASRRTPPPATEPADDGAAGAMGFLEHLDELRGRLIRACIAIVAGMAVAYAYSGPLGAFILEPARRALPPGTHLQLTRLGEGFTFYLDVALLGGLLLTSPYVLFQVWRFIAPGLYAREKRLVLPFVLMAALGTAAGFAFTHYLLFPSMVTFFATFDSPDMTFAPRVEDVFTQYKNMLLGMIAVFQLPTLVFFLARMRMVTARFLWQRMQYAVLAAFILAAVLTPAPDPWNQVLLAAPMLAMYLVSVGVAWLAAPRGGSHDGAPPLRLVVSAAMLGQAMRRQRQRVTRPAGRAPRVLSGPAHWG